MSEILSRKDRRARNAHMCDICHTEIMPGESYIHMVFTDGGKVLDSNHHIHCDALTERYCMANGLDEYDSSEVREWAEDEICTECEARKTPHRGCRKNPLTCPIVLEGLLPQALLTHEDLRRHLTGGGKDE